MKIIDPGHKYQLEHISLTNEPGHVENSVVSFIKTEPRQPGDSVLEVVQEGTTNEEVIKMMINRLEYLEKKIPSNFNQSAIVHLKLALDALKKRTEDRKGRGVISTNKE